MILKKISLLVVLFLNACSWFESDYSKIMSPIQKLKQAEKDAGKQSPIYNGFREPDFPDLKENNKTLDGIDSNKDGVRDDVEIWINRVADDDYVRLELKHLYRTKMMVHKSVWFDEPIEVQSEKSFLYTSNLICLSVVLQPYMKKYLSLGFERDRILNAQLSQIIFNNSERKALVTKINSFQGKEPEYRVGDFSNCDKDIDREYFELMRNSYNRDWSKK